MPNFRCPRGTHRCRMNGICVRKSARQTPRCPKGSRKCANQICYGHAVKKNKAARKIQKAFRNHNNLTRSAKTIQEAFRNFLFRRQNPTPAPAPPAPAPTRRRPREEDEESIQRPLTRKKRPRPSL